MLVELQRRVQKKVHEGGFRRLVSSLLNTVQNFVRLVATYWVPYLVCVLSLIPLRQFTFQAQKYRYFCHPTNATWRSERCVEIPIAYRTLKSRSWGNVLEVGNVLGLYFPIQHDVVDKYEVRAGVLNVDIVDFRPPEKYDLIISISTIEHIGWDEKPREPKKVLRAIEHLISLLAPEGVMLFTIPMGWNAELDYMLRKGLIRFSDFYCLKRVSSNNRWREADWNEVRDARYGFPFPGANAFLVGIIRGEREACGQVPHLRS